jgi:hypothetical protein
MKLKPVPTYPAVELKGRVSRELHRALTAYAEYYRQTTGQGIELWPLVVRMLQQFVDEDREFQGWRRRTPDGPGGGPMTG